MIATKAKLSIAAGVLVLTTTGAAPGPQTGQSAAGDQPGFLKQYWQSPIPLQGKPPPTYSELEASLDSASCGACHSAQFDDWRTSVHSKSVGPGLLGQTPGLLANDPDTPAMCYTCHAPLAEQQELYKAGRRFQKNRRFDARLQRGGLTCAGCHVRNHRRFGPPRRDGSLEDVAPPEQLPHGGATRTAGFERAEFCVGCHQFEAGDKALNGKLLENTYSEWMNSPYGKQGVACQQCHMPDRRHLWRGIHDAEMVRSGVQIELSTNKARYEAGDQIEATLTLTNSGVGHYFPTYVTPRVVLRMELVDAGGRTIPGSAQEEYVGREVTLDLSREVFDSRIPPSGEHRLHYTRTVDLKAQVLRAEVRVLPDEFYRRFYKAKLKGRLSAGERGLLSEALQEARRSAYTLFEKRVQLSGEPSAQPRNRELTSRLE